MFGGNESILMNDKSDSDTEEIRMSKRNLKEIELQENVGLISNESNNKSKEKHLNLKKEEIEESWTQTVITFGFCFCGLQAAYLTWGVLQELLMSTQYNPTENVPDGRFPSATFCVFCNRIFAIVIAAVVCLYKHGQVSSAAPLWYVSPSSFSNTMSSYCQYASLSFVPFPVQNLFKSMKIIPVMLMGKLLKGSTYPWIQYGEAALITLGVIIFSQSSNNSSKGHGHLRYLSETTSTSTTDGSNSIVGDSHDVVNPFGFLLLFGYIFFDCFTSQWQSKVYTEYGKIDSYHMMFGVNFWSIIFTSFYLLTSGELWLVLEFLESNERAAYYSILTGIMSAMGQLFIFYTIKRFGPVALTIIMTTRQMFSMIISSIMFGHTMGSIAIAGECLVFGTVAAGVYRQYREKAAKAAAAGGGDSDSGSGSNTIYKRIEKDEK